MVCVQCGHETGVTNSRRLARTNQVWRRRRCHQCQSIFTTLETTDYAHTWIVRRTDGHVEPFLRDKLYLSLFSSCQHRQRAITDTAALTDTVIKNLLTQIKDSVLEIDSITTTALVTLNRFDKVAGVHYQAFHP